MYSGHPRNYNHAELLLTSTRPHSKYCCNRQKDQKTVLFNVLFSTTTWVSRGTRKVEPIWILMKQEMLGWQWHQLQVICTSLQTDNHASNSIVSQTACSSWRPINSVKALKACCSHTWPSHTRVISHINNANIVAALDTKNFLTVAASAYIWCSSLMVVRCNSNSNKS